jgi:hypothetical protein
MSSFNSQDLVKVSLDHIRDEFLQNVVDSSNDLTSTRKHYISSIKTSTGSNSVEISLEGFIANALENGMSSFDIKKGLENSGKRTVGKKDGWWLTVPLGQNNLSTSSSDINVSRLLGQVPSVSQKPVSFRRVNDKSQGWIHKGIEAHNIFEAAREITDIEAIVDNVLKQLIKR